MLGLLPHRVLLQLLAEQRLFIIPTKLNTSYCVWLQQSCKLKQEGFYLFIYLFLHIYLLYKCTWYTIARSTWTEETCLHFDGVFIIFIYFNGGGGGRAWQRNRWHHVCFEWVGEGAIERRGQ